MKNLLLTIFLTLPTISFCDTYTPGRIPTLDELKQGLTRTLHSQPTHSRWQKVIDLANYQYRMTHLDDLLAYMEHKGVDQNTCVQGILSEHQRQLDVFLAAKKNLYQPSLELRKHLHKLLESTHLQLHEYPTLMIGTAQEIDHSPAGICIDLNNSKATLLIHTRNELSADSFRDLPHDVPYVFTELPESMQEGILHHELAHLPTIAVDTIILALAKVCYHDAPSEENRIYNNLETCVDMTAVRTSKNPIATAQGLYDFFALHEKILAHKDNQERMAALEEIQDQINNSPRTHVSSILTAAKPHVARGFATLVGAAKNIIAHLPK